MAVVYAAAVVVLALVAGGVLLYASKLANAHRTEQANDSVRLQGYRQVGGGWSGAKQYDTYRLGPHSNDPVALATGPGLSLYKTSLISGLFEQIATGTLSKGSGDTCNVGLGRLASNKLPPADANVSSVDEAAIADGRLDLLVVSVSC